MQLNVTIFTKDGSNINLLADLDLLRSGLADTNKNPFLTIIGSDSVVSVPVSNITGLTAYPVSHVPVETPETDEDAEQEE